MEDRWRTLLKNNTFGVIIRISSAINMSSRLSWPRPLRHHDKDEWWELITRYTTRREYAEQNAGPELYDFLIWRNITKNINLLKNLFKFIYHIIKRHFLRVLLFVTPYSYDYRFEWQIKSLILKLEIYQLICINLRKSQNFVTYSYQTMRNIHILRNI